MVIAMATSLTIYLTSLLFFHTSEFLLALFFDPSQCAVSSFLLSTPYVVAMACSLLEYHVTMTAFPIWKVGQLQSLRACACVGIFAGECLRKSAWLTARTSFTHLIQYAKRREHALVQHGVYRWCRHPAYLGWFIWALSTQVLLGNAISFCVFTAVIYRFFKRRIIIEEFYLVQFFGSRYVRYRERTPTWIPGIA